MRKKLIIISSGILVVLAVVLTGVFLMQPWKFRLSSEYYGKSGFREIDAGELEILLNEKEAFAVFVYQPACRASDDFEKILAEFSEKSQISFEKIAFSEIKNSGLAEGLKFYPSVIIYHNGRAVNFLRADDNEDMLAYETLDGFENWWGKYIK